MSFVPHNQEETDARELAQSLLSALGAPADVRGDALPAMLG